MWLILIACFVALGFGAVFFGFVPPPHARTLLHFRSGSVRATRGILRPYAREHISEILTEAKVTKGFIAITSGNRVVFSRGIPSNVHQRLRNVLLNQLS